MKGLLLALVIATACGTSTATPECPPITSSYYTIHLPNPSDCNSFYKCAAGKPVLMQCFTGLHWNQQLQVCDWPDSANCKESSQPQQQEQQQPPSWQTGGAAPGQANPEGNFHFDNVAPHDPQLITQTCQDNLHGYQFRDPDDCAAFYTCVWLTPVRQACPRGTLYNNRMRVCDWPEQVDCCENTELKPCAP